MNKLTKLLSIFLIAGAVGTGVAGVAGCNNSKPSGSKHTHNYSYTQNSDGKTHNGTCDKSGCDKPTITNEACVDGDDEDKLCDKCQQPIVTDSGEDDPEGELVTTTVDFSAAAKALNGGEATTAQMTVGEGGYDYLGKINFAKGNRFEPSNSCVNTQKNTITVTLSGQVNSIKINGMGASTSGNAKVVIKSATETLAESEPVGNKVTFTTLLVEKLPKGTYTIETLDYSARLTEITVTELMEVGTPESIVTVNPAKTDFLIGDAFVSEGTTVMVKYTNSAQKAQNKITVDDKAVDMSKAGKYTVGVSYTENGTTVNGSYDVYVYTIDEIELHTIGYDGKNQLTLQQAAITGGEIVSTNLTVKGTGTVEGHSHTFNLPTKALNIELPSTAAAGEKTANVSVNTEYTTGGKTLADSYKVMVKDAVTPTNNKVELTVGATGDFKTLTQAIQYLDKCEFDDSVNKIIKIQAGKYEEKVWIEVPNVTLIGLGATADDTKISCSLVEGDKDPLNGSAWGLGCATVHVGTKGTGFKAYKLNISNDFNYIKNSGNYSGTQAAQGVALTIDADGAVIANCHLYGNQDTLFMKNGRTYYYKTQIDGNVDFIFGNETGLAYFEECKIVAINRTEIILTEADKAAGKTEEDIKGKEQNGYITAAKHVEGTKTQKPDYGYIFYKCEVTDDGKVKDGAMSLGRPWGADATVAYIECSFSKAYSVLASNASGKDHRWNDWNASTTAANADFKEYGSTGEGAISTAVTGGSIIDKATADLHTKANIFGTANGAKVGYSTVFECDAELLKLQSYASGEALEEYTLTIKDTEGNTVATKKYTQGENIIIAELKEYINNLDSVKNDDKEVDKIYQSYTDATDNEELTEDSEITKDGELIISIKAKDHSVALTDRYTFDVRAAASNVNFTQTVAQGEDNIVTFGKLKIYGGSTTSADNKFTTNNNQWYIIKGDAYIEFTVSAPIRAILGSYSGGGLTLTKVGGDALETVDAAASMKFDITEAGTYRITATGSGQQYIDEIKFAAVPEKDVTVTVYNTDGETPTAVGEAWTLSSTDLVNESKLKALRDSLTAPAGKEFDDYYTDAACTTKFDPKNDKLEAGTKGIYIGWKTAVTEMAVITETSTFDFKNSTPMDAVAKGETKHIDGKLFVNGNENGSFAPNSGGWYVITGDATIEMKVKAGTVVTVLIGFCQDCYTFNFAGEDLEPMTGGELEKSEYSGSLQTYTFTASKEGVLKIRRSEGAGTTYMGTITVTVPAAEE